MIITVLKQIATYVGIFLKLTEKVARAVKYATRKTRHNILFQNIKDFYRTAVLAVSIATSKTDRTNRNEITHRNNRNSQNHHDT